MTRCETRFEALSALLDGELVGAEQAELEQHLQRCARCRSELERLEAADGLLVGVVPEPSAELEIKIRRALAAVPDAEPGPAAPMSRRGLRSVARYASAALVLIAVSLVILVTSDQAGASRAVEPLVAIEALNEQAEKDQQTLFQTLEWELRSLRLELACMELGAAESELLNSRLESLLHAVEQAEDRIK